MCFTHMHIVVRVLELASQSFDLTLRLLFLESP